MLKILLIKLARSNFDPKLNNFFIVLKSKINLGNHLLYFDKMIPASIKEVWLAGLESKEYFIKLCGAGGGGFFMIYTPTDKVPLDHSLIKIP